MLPIFVRPTTASGGYHRQPGWLMAAFIADGARTTGGVTRGFPMPIDTEINSCYNININRHCNIRGWF